MKVGNTIYQIGGAIGTSFSDLVISMKGQKNNYAIIQTAHRIEKGLTVQNPRKMWGWNKIEKLIRLISKEIDSEDPDLFAVETGIAVLKAYKDSKLHSGENGEAKKAERFLETDSKIRQLVENSTFPGGIRNIRCSDIIFDEREVRIAGRLFQTRHSIRDFDGRKISGQVLNQAVTMALQSPSACNRQPSRIYVISGEQRESLGYENIYHADKYLIITADINAFTRGEYGDWVVSASIFSAYLVLALHTYGIGSCIMRKSMLFGDRYNTKVRQLCAIPKNEKIVLEIAVGYYKEEFTVAYSDRRKAEDVVKYITGNDK